jgi:hypothetical protein
MSRLIAPILLLAALALSGCAQPNARTNEPANEASKAQPSARLSPEIRPESLDSLDPCAMRLHDLCEPLLLYYVKNRRLPPSLEELALVSGFEQIPLTCPVSNRQYQYDPAGKTLKGSPDAQVILYDATPAHGGNRWAIAIIEPASRADSALITKTVLLPDSFFTNPSK